MRWTENYIIDNGMVGISDLYKLNGVMIHTEMKWGIRCFNIFLMYSDKKMTDMIFKQIKNALRKLSAENNIDVSVSIGVSVYPNDAKTLEALLNIADRKMYENKA